jgi:hypothetical protein
MTTTLRSWDCVQLGDTVHSIRHRKPRRSALWCGKRVTSPRRMTQGDITCPACLKAIREAGRKYTQMEQKFVKAEAAMAAMGAERTKLLAQGWPMPERSART